MDIPWPRWALQAFRMHRNMGEDGNVWQDDDADNLGEEFQVMGRIFQIVVAMDQDFPAIHFIENLMSPLPIHDDIADEVDGIGGRDNAVVAVNDGLVHVGHGCEVTQRLPIMLEFDDVLVAEMMVGNDEAAGEVGQNFPPAS